MRERTIGLLVFLGVASGCGGTESTGSNATPTNAPPSATHTLVPTQTAASSATATALPTATATGDPIASLPVDATIQLPGLPGSVSVVTDELGMPHVYGSNLDSVLFVQGYLVAASRFWEMDVVRRFGEGRLSELFGAITFETDVAMRTVFTTRDGRRLEEALWQHVQEVDAEVTNAVEAYASGINAWLADLRAGRNGATLPPEYTVAIINAGANDLAPWRPQDTVAIARLQAWDLSSTLDEEIQFARIMRQLPQAMFKDVFRSAPAAPATVLPGPGRGATPKRASVLPHAAATSEGVLAEVHTLLTRVAQASPFGDRERGIGSNNWIVAPSLSANGHAMLANDPHLALFNPPIWFMQQLDAGGPPEANNRVNGVNFPGLPGVILGHNGYGAWGATVAVFDVTDVYEETVSTPPDYPASPRAVLFQGQQVPVLRIEERILVKRLARTALIEVVPHHGPMVPDPNLNDGVVGLAATNMSFRWTGHEITNDERFLLDLNRARNVSEFKAAVRSFAVGAQNWVWADVHGDIAYFPYVLVPQRPPGTVPYLPVPGTGEAEWLTDGEGNTAWLPEEKFPQATNPPEGFLATANNDQIGNTLDNDPLNDEIYLTFAADLGFREQRIHEMLSNSAGDRAAGARITLEDMSRFQYDAASKEAARLLPFLFAAGEHRPDLVSAAMHGALDRLRRWGERRAGSPPYETVAGVDPSTGREDVPPRGTPISDEERADAVASSLFAAWLTRLVPAVLNDDFAGTGISVPGGGDATKAFLHLLEDIDRSDPGFVVHTKDNSGESTLWDDQRTPERETRDEMLLAALRDALPFLERQFGSPEPSNWLWGLIHQVQLQHFFGQAGLPFFDLGPFAAPGGRFTVNPAGFSATRDTFLFSGGPSQRFVAVLDPAGITAVNSLPGGQNGNPGGEGAERYNTINPATHYGDLVPDWINGKTFAYHVTKEDVAAHAVRHVRYTP
jgi:penicillin amidase